MDLSKRLETIASFVTKGRIVADVGTDHGYIPIFLTQSGKCPKAYAMDLNQGPLNRAKMHIEEENVGEQVTCILSDGLNQLPDKEVDSIIIAGMGGDLVIQILSKGIEKLENIKELILSPQSHMEKVRHFLHDHGFRILEEDFLKEDGKYYTIMRAVHGKGYFEKECFYYFGEELILNKNEMLLEYLNGIYEKYNQIYGSLSEDNKEHIKVRKEEVAMLLDYIKEACLYYEL